MHQCNLKLTWIHGIPSFWLSSAEIEHSRIQTIDNQNQPNWNNWPPKTRYRDR